MNIYQTCTIVKRWESKRYGTIHRYFDERRYCWLCGINLQSPCVILPYLPYHLLLQKSHIMVPSPQYKLRFIHLHILNIFTTSPPIYVASGVCRLFKLFRYPAPPRGIISALTSILTQNDKDSSQHLRLPSIDSKHTTPNTHT